jgi:hypothetical protein
MNNKKKFLYRATLGFMAMAITATTMSGCSTMTASREIGKGMPVANDWINQDKDLNRDMVRIPFLYNGVTTVKTWRDMANLSKESIRTYGSFKHFEISERFLISAKESVILPHGEENDAIHSIPTLLKNTIIRDAHSLHKIDSEIDYVSVFVFIDTERGDKVAVMVDNGTKKVIGVSRL